ncbi:hypothetical protein, partial [Collimonas sp.]|jgi:hypothetical protein|uniref:hypothetical protein n=1 Tax=Collimonas sp. TaxID=1963772 RepID=UPI0037BE7224
LNSAVYICFGIFFIAGLSKGSLILRYLWKTKFRGKLSFCATSISRWLPANTLPSWVIPA